VTTKKDPSIQRRNKRPLQLLSAFVIIQSIALLVGAPCTKQVAVISSSQDSQSLKITHYEVTTTIL